MPTKDPIKLKAKRKRYYIKYKSKVITRFKNWKEKNPEKYKKIKKQSDFKRLRLIEKRPLFMFKHIKQRVGKRGAYKERKLLFTKEQFMIWILNNESYKLIFKQWQDSNFKFSLCPTVDRINNNGDYSLDNIQILTQSQNSIKGAHMV